MLGLDTGFFVQLLQGHTEPVRLWTALIQGDEQAVCSCLSLFELERLSYKGAIGREVTEKLCEAIPALCQLVWIDRRAVISTGAGVSHGIGLPAVDALILAGLIEAGASKIYTTDADFERYVKRGISVINLRQYAK